MEKRCRFQVCPRRWFSSSLHVVGEQGSSLFYYTRKVSLFNLILYFWSCFIFQCDIRQRQVDQQEIESLCREQSFVGWTETSAKEDLMVSDCMRLYIAVNKLITRQFRYLSVSLYQVFDWSDDTVQKISIDRPFRPIAQGLLFFYSVATKY